jgi:hypothetical protein
MGEISSLKPDSGSSRTKFTVTMHIASYIKMEVKKQNEYVYIRIR